MVRFLQVQIGDRLVAMLGDLQKRVGKQVIERMAQKLDVAEVISRPYAELAERMRFPRSCSAISCSARSRSTDS